MEDAVVDAGRAGQYNRRRWPVTALLTLVVLTLLPVKPASAFWTYVIPGIAVVCSIADCTPPPPPPSCSVNVGINAWREGPFDAKATAPGSAGCSASTGITLKVKAGSYSGSSSAWTDVCHCASLNVTTPFPATSAALEPNACFRGFSNGEFAPGDPPGAITMSPQVCV